MIAGDNGAIGIGDLERIGACRYPPANGVGAACLYIEHAAADALPLLQWFIFPAPFRLIPGKTAAFFVNLVFEAGSFAAFAVAAERYDIEARVRLFSANLPSGAKGLMPTT